MVVLVVLVVVLTKRRKPGKEPTSIVHGSQIARNVQASDIVQGENVV